MKLNQKKAKKNPSKSSWTSHTIPFSTLKVRRAKEEELRKKGRRRSFNLDLAIKRILSVNYAVYQRQNKENRDRVEEEEETSGAIKLMNT